MENDQNRIDELKSRIGENKIDLKQIYQTVGERAAVPEVFPGGDDSISESLEKLSRLNKQLGDIDVQINDLRNSFNRIAEITSREQDIGEEYSVLEKENRKLFLPIGKAVYVDWKDKRTDLFPKLMKSIEEQELKILSFENEVFKLTNNDVKKNFINKLKNKSRIILLNSKKRSIEASMGNLYKKTGEKVYKNDISFFEQLNTESVEKFIENRKIISRLDTEIASLKEENSRLEKHLKSKFSSSKQKKAEEKLQSERDFLMSGKMSELNDLGSSMYGGNLDFGDSQLQSLFKDAAEIHKKNDLLAKDIELCKAELEIVKLDEEVADMKKNIKDLELTIEKCTGDIAEFNKEIKRAKSEIRKLKKLTEEGTEKKEE